MLPFAPVNKDDDAALAHWCDVGHARWSFSIAPSVLSAYLAQHAVPHDARHAHAADLYLAAACASGDAAAIAAFEAELVPVIRQAVRRLHDSDHDEVVQIVRERVLVAPVGGAPRIAEYSGQGPLRAWVRIAAMRLALNALRAGRRWILVGDVKLFETIAAEHGDGRSAERYREAATDALRAAFTTLSPRDRNLLRMHHLHGLSVDELAPALGVHRATVARWIAAAREQLLAQTRLGLVERLHVGASTIDSVLAGIASEVDVSVVRLLAEDA